MSGCLAFELRNISYSYPTGEKALNCVNLAIKQGERLILLGPNGCGKSTLQKIMAGLLFPEGEVLAFGRAITEKSMSDQDFAAHSRRLVGFVFQNSDVQIFCASVLDEIMFGPLAAGETNFEAHKRATEIMEYMDIADLAARLPHHLSGGEKKKVAIAAILATNPAVLILDEPTNGLDPRTERWVVEAINELSQRGKTIITATHHLNLVPELGERVVVMGENRSILAQGTPKDVLLDRSLLLEANLIDERYHVHFHGSDHLHVHRQGM